MVTSWRQLGTLTRSPPASSWAWKPSASRICLARSVVTSSPPRLATSPVAKVRPISGSGAAPATTNALASPPQSSRINWVAASMPGSVEAGSMPRSNR